MVAFCRNGRRRPNAYVTHGELSKYKSSPGEPDKKPQDGIIFRNL